MDPDDLYHEHRAVKRAVAKALTLLRKARDESPEEWDALMFSHSGPAVSDAWSVLRRHFDEDYLPDPSEGQGVEETNAFRSHLRSLGFR